jgi:hypothetical protein
LLAVASCQSPDRVEWVDYGEDPMQNPEFLADMAAAGTPGSQHAAIAARAGSWKAEGKVWMEPGSDPMPMVATARMDSLLGGRYLVEEFISDFMGTPFEGHLLQGYDNVTQRYWSLWIDSMSTGYWLSHGTETSPGRIELEGTATDILTPNGRPVRMTITSHGSDSYTMKMFDSHPEGGEYQSMELHYTRD